MTASAFGFTLDAVQVRVLGCLVEKEATTPGSYPLTVNALRNACNQSTSRDPVMDCDERQVESSLLALRDLRLARPVRGPGDRVTKFRHAFDEAVGLAPDELAALSVLMLRGPQTLGEIRTRTTRQFAFESVERVADTMAALADRGFVVELPRGPGQKEARWTHLLRGEPERGSDPQQGAATRPQDGGPSGIVAAYLAGAEAVVAVLGDPLLAAAWDDASVLEEQTVGSVAGHIARGGVWLVADYLDGGTRGVEPDFTSAGQYFARVTDGLDEDAHRAIRNRGAAQAAVGPDELAATARARLDQVEVDLVEGDLDAVVAVYGGLTMRLGDYLATRIVEQAVHLDDLARSVDGLEVDLPEAVVDIALATGAATLRLRRGSAPALRALFRDGYQDALPVL